MSRTALHRRLKRWLKLAAQPTSYHKQALQEQLAMNRRQLIKNIGQAGAMLTIPGLLPDELYAKSAGTAKLQHAGLTIVGGGLAGLSTAYTLAKAGVGSIIFEGSKRAGGRIKTRYQFHEDKLFWEEGGEFVDTDHHALQGLAAELGIPIQDLRTQDRGLSQEFYYFDGQRYYENDIIKAFAPLSKILSRDSKALFRDDEFFVPSIYDGQEEAIRRLDHMSLAAYLDKLKAHVDAWVLELIRIAYVGEYGLEADEQSALNLLILVEPSLDDGFAIFGESDEAYRLTGGSARIIEALLKRINDFKLPFHTEHRLIAIREKAQQITLVFDQNGQTVEHQTRQVIFAIPFSTLREVDGIAKLSIPAVKKKAIEELGYGTNSKLGIATKQRFWRLPNQVWKASNGSLFTDLASQCFWDSSRKQESPIGILTCFLGGNSGKDVKSDFKQTVHQDLSRIFPACEEYFTDTALLANWSENPFAKGSYSCPRPGQYTSLIGSTSRPQKSDRYFFVGEHCSVDYGGYMNGAVSSSLQVAVTLLSGT